MANGFVCAQCGWQESIHIHGGWALTEDERETMFILKVGYRLTQIQCAQSYEPSAAELAEEARQAGLGGAHEGCH